jgi:hypothetical protein
MIKLIIIIIIIFLVDFLWVGEFLLICDLKNNSFFKTKIVTNFFFK